MKIALVTDSTAYLPKDMIDKYNVFVIPLNIIFENDSYREGVDITTAEFYKKVKTEENLPTTSQPAIGEMVKLYEELSNDYDAIISIHLSKRLSGTFEASQTAGNMVENIPVYSIDSTITTIPQGFLVMEAGEMIKDGMEVERIIDVLNNYIKNMTAYFMVADLSHLQRGGRLSGAQKIVGSLLNIKPVLHITDGQIKPFEKIRSKKKALKRIHNLLEQDALNKTIKKVAFVHANNEQGALELEKEFKDKYPYIETHISYFGPVIGTHIGEGALGAAWYFEN
ncbi:MAG TPA: DegV family protein [Pseudogracilibacillus sp.]|nr:DegV family protein [Pseudogracilibacillus sp.]